MSSEATADFEFDLAVVGAGSAGVRAARVASQLGAKVAVIEAAQLGGTCVNVGCIPKKLLVYGSRFGRAFHEARGYGWDPPPARFDWSALIARKDAEIARLNQAYAELLRSSGATTISGRARVVDAHTIEVDGTRLRSRYLLVATGGAAHVPACSGHELAITSDHAFHLARLPTDITIVGGGYIALEFAGIFRSLGVAVQVVHRGERLLRSFDHEISDELARALQRRGVDLRLGVELQAIRREGAAVRLELSDGSSELRAQVMFAVGRAPRTAGFGLEQAGVRLRADGAVLVNAFGRSSVANIFAAGDCTGGVALTPLAIAEGQAVAQTLFGADPVAVDRELIPTAVFSQPSVACVGLSEDEARARGLAIDVYGSRFTSLFHRLSDLPEPTLVKVVVERQSQRVLGCHMLGDDAAEIIQGMAVALRCGLTKTQLDSTLAIHPTLAEEFVTMRTRRSD